MPDIRTPVIRTFYSKTVDIYPILFIPVIRTLNAVSDDVLITGIHCIGSMIQYNDIVAQF